nr:hypothetical protein HK105_006716 [Polyrhizophydium stewartii]
MTANTPTPATAAVKTAAAALLALLSALPRAQAQVPFPPLNLTWLGGDSLTVEALGPAGLVIPGLWPSARSQHAVAADTKGNVWVHGGLGYGLQQPLPGTEGFLQDLWMYSPSRGAWGFMSGQPQPGWTEDAPQLPLGTASASMWPSFRTSHAMWSDGSDGLMLFGGVGPYGGSLIP